MILPPNQLDGVETMRQPDWPSLAALASWALRPGLSAGLPFSRALGRLSVSLRLSPFWGFFRVRSALLQQGTVDQPDQFQSASEGLHPLPVRPGDGPLPRGVLGVQDAYDESLPFSSLFHAC